MLILGSMLTQILTILDDIAVAMVTVYFQKSYHILFRSAETHYLNWLKTCHNIILWQRHYNFCLKMILRHILG